MARIENDRGEAVYFNLVKKRDKTFWVIQGIGDTVVYGRDKQKRKSRTFRQCAQAEAYLKRHGFTKATY